MSYSRGCAAVLSQMSETQPATTDADAGSERTHADSASDGYHSDSDDSQHQPDRYCLWCYPCIQTTVS